MFHVSVQRAVAVRISSVLANIALTLGGPPSVPGQAVHRPSPLTREEGQQLEERASELNEAGHQAYHACDLVQAVARVTESLKIREKLYPRVRYVLGHPDLAASLNAMGFLLQAKGSYAEARVYHESALTMRESLYPKNLFPHGHPDVATSLNNLGSLLHAQGSFREARGYFERALAMRQALYPKDHYPQGHPELAHSLNNLGGVLEAQGSYGEARGYFERALAMNQSLYPQARYPQGHQELTTSLNNLGALLQAQGLYEEARVYYERALAMDHTLYPTARYPQGHPDLASSLNNLGFLLRAQGCYGEARTFYQRALEMYESLYPKARYPQGHPELAKSLSNLGVLLQAQASYAEARGYLQRALAMWESIYPKHRHPQGHPDLATALNNLGLLLHDQGSYVEARAYLERALALRESLYPKARYPEGHPDLARGLNNLGALHAAQGSYAKARAYYERALAMLESIYPKDRYSQGHPELATSLNNLGGLLEAQGSYAEARGYFERALAMNQSLYPQARYPQGHPELATSLNNLGGLLLDQGLFAEARGYHERALAMNLSLYPKERYPRGHPELANSLNNLGGLLERQGSYGKARGYFERALAMRRSLYPNERYPKGHPDLAGSLNNLGILLEAEGSSYEEARGYFERALAMRRSLYPKDGYPNGHPELTQSLGNLGGLLQAEGSCAEAAVFLGQATDMQQAIGPTLLAATSEAEAMSYLAQLALTRDGLISVSLRQPGRDDQTYRRIWNGKAALTRILYNRQAATLVRSGPNPAVRDTIEAWRDARSQLARLILATADGRDHSERVAMIQELGSKKERLERELAAAVPEFGRNRVLQQSVHSDLLKAMPEGTAVIDFLRFIRFEQDPQAKGKKGERRTASYVGFLLAKGEPVRMVDLGPAEPIESAISRWRRAIVHGKKSPAGAELRRLVWEPLARHLPKGTTTVYLAPDGTLSAIPWGALPGERPGTVLLEQYALAIVPHAPFLLEHLTARTSPGHDGNSGILLAVGAVAYGERPKAVKDNQTRLQLLAVRSAELKRGGESAWANLPGTLRELDAVSRLASSREILRLQGAEAGTAPLLQALPRARWAHIATHGFFAHPSIRSVLSPDPKLFGMIGTERIGAGLRNPLVLSGLVLAGASRPRSEDDLLAHDDRGILTAEAIAGLDLSGMELAVLSACETGLGLVGGGEGVFGLQRAFHLAGAHNVIASLWKVDDQATAALMALFYEKLWRQGKPPLEALREAQLALYREPELVGKLASARGTPDFDKLVRLPEPAPGSDGSARPRRAPARQWAAFVLSGDGR
jgi:tetratricopeptide (TPR) repeat protein/CHAT domain-containing protein